MKTDTMMRFGKHARALAAALAIGATVLSLSTTPSAFAVPKDGDGEVLCTYTNPDGTVWYYPVGTRMWDKFSGKMKTCGEDGKWQRDGATEGPVAPKPTGGGVLGR